MHTLETKIRNDISLNGIIGKRDHLLVGVSGGADSIGLLHILAALSGELDLTLTAAYVDHGLRPAETESEMDLVEKTAVELGVGFCTGVVDVRKVADNQGLSIEEAARDLRYGFLAEAACKYNCSRVAVAHTSDDQAEELLIRLIRGAGRRGLSGMAQINFRNVVRPLLNTTKADIISYLTDREISYLEDSSNEDRAYLRNRVRLDLLPYLTDNFNPSIRETLLRTANIFRAEEEVLNSLTDEVCGHVITSEEGPDYYVIDSPALAEEAVALQRRVVERVLTDLSSPVSFQQVEKIRALILEGKDGSELHLYEGLRVIKKGKAVLLFYPAGRNRQRGKLAVEVKGFQLDIPCPGSFRIPEPSVEFVVSVLDETPDKKELMSGKVDYLDMKSFDFPLLIRSSQSGDRFRPLGGPGSRKVADFLSDQKVPKVDRWQVPVLIKDAEVLAVLGLRIDDRFRLVSDTSKVLKVEIRPLPEHE